MYVHYSDPLKISTNGDENMILALAHAQYELGKQGLHRVSSKAPGLPSITTGICPLDNIAYSSDRLKLTALI